MLLMWFVHFVILFDKSHLVPGLIELKETGIKLDSRIMPTIPLIPHSKPWLVALFRGNKYYACTGALIGRYSVLTAAHCCMVSKAALGAHCYDGIRLEEMTSIVSFQAHLFRYDYLKEFSPIGMDSYCTFDLDVGIAKLEWAANINDPRIKMAKIAAPNVGCPNQGLDIAGWGKTKKPHESQVYESVCPNWLPLNCMDMNLCKELHTNCDSYDPDCGERQKLWNAIIDGNHPNVLESHPSFSQMYMCANTNLEEADACEGDSGAPIARNGSDEIYGVLSAGFDCNKPIQSRIGIYTVVNSPFIHPFITSTIQGFETTEP